MVKIQAQAQVEGSMLKARDGKFKAQDWRLMLKAKDQVSSS